MHAAVIQKGTSRGGAAGFAQYIAREEPDKAITLLRYSDPVTGREDLVDTGHGGLPAWAESPTHFWQMADRYERGGPQRPGTVARTYEVALPRELAPQDRLALAADIRATFFERYPHTWAIHNPIDPQGLEHPHMHLMLSERRQTDTHQRTPEVYFAQAASPHQDPTTHGVRKDRSWQGPARLVELRAGIAVLTNAALERADTGTAVSHASLTALGYGRAPAVYVRRQDKPTVEHLRADIHAGIHQAEAQWNRLVWHLQKQREGMRDVSREAIVDHVRDRFWQQDRTPARDLERQESLMRAIDRECARTGRAQGMHVTPAQTQQQTRQHVRALQRSHGLARDDVAHGGAQVRLGTGWEQER